MSTSKKKQRVRPESKVRKVNGVSVADGGTTRTTDGMISVSTTADLPTATNLPDGSLAIDTTRNGLKYTSSGAWVLLGTAGLYETGDLPSATSLPDGILAVDLTLNHLVYTQSGNWVTASGA